MLSAVTFVPAPPRRPAPAPALAPARRGSRLARWTSAIAVALTASSTAAARPADPAPLPDSDFSDSFAGLAPASPAVAVASREARAEPALSASSPAPSRGLAAGRLLARAEPAPPASSPAPTFPGPATAPPPSSGASPSAPADSPASAASPAPSASSPAPADSSTAAAEPGPEDSSRSDRKIEGPADAAVAPAPAEVDKPAPRQPGAKPPRVDGTYVGGTLGPGISFARVNNFPTPNPFVGGGGTLRVGEVVYPWMSVGVEISGNLGYRSADPRQRLLQGAFLVDFGFYPGAKKQLPLSLRAGFGAGGGAVRERGRAERSGFGGAVFTAAVRYEFFPGAARRRPTRGGGFSLGPELGWIGFMPAAKGRPMSHTVYLGLYVGFYFGS